MATVWIRVEKPEDGYTVEVPAGQELVLGVDKERGEPATGVKWTRDGEDVGVGDVDKVEIDEVGDEHAGKYKAVVGGEEVSITVKIDEEAEEEDDNDDKDPAELGAYAQFESDELEGVAKRLWRVVWFAAGALIAAMLFFGVVSIRLSSDWWRVNVEPAQRFPAAFSSVLFVTGIMVICIGAWLQAASLRVAKIRPKEGTEVEVVAGLAVVNGVTLSAAAELFTKMAEAAKSLKVPVAVILVGAAMVIMSAVTVINTGEAEPCFTVDSGQGEPVEIRGAEQPADPPEGVAFGDC